jgi:DNA-binding winged helix-turn-helix (wHTH) protein/tetratricopeptide (TPR) repeat protein
MTDNRTRENYEFDNFCILTAERVLLRDGKPQALPPKVFDILLVLVEHSGHLVEKAELMDQVWPETHVEENNLTVNMSALRRALGEDRKYIETVPRRGYRFVADVRKVSDEKTEPGEKRITETGGARGVLRDEVINSLAVLPFANLSDNPNLEYLSDGITESIINSLSQLPQLKTMARSTVFRYKDQKIAPLEAGRDMRVRSVLVGRVLQSGDSLNISTELVDVMDGSQIWSEQYNRQFLNILAAQEEISREVSEQLRLKLTTEERRRFAKRYTENIEAYHLYLKGRYFWSKYTKEGVDRSIEYYQQAIAADPVYALAYAGLAEAYYALSTTYLPPREAMPKARAAVMKALEIDGTLSEAHSTLGMIGMLYDWDWAEAERAYQRAIEFSPRNAIAHQRYGMYLDMMGRFDEGLAEMKLAQELDPLSLPTNVNIGVTYYLMGQYDRAIAQYKSALEMDPSFSLAHHHLAQVYTIQGRFPEALEEFQNAKLLEESPFALGHLGRIYAMMGKRSEALKILDRLKELSKQSYVSPYRLTMIYAALGEMDRAFEWLEKAYLDRSEELAWLNIFPVPGNLRSDPRFTDLLRRIGFPTG